MSKRKSRYKRVEKRAENKKKEERSEKQRKTGIKSSVFAVILSVVIIAGVIFVVKSMNFNIPPTQPYVKYPSDNQKGVPRNVKLEWGCEDPNGDKLSYDLYLGESTPSLVATSLKFPAYRVELLPGKEYVWRVVAKDGKGGISKSPTWRFKTAENNPPSAPKALNPSAGETVNSTTVVLSWTSSDPDGDEVSYDLYLDGKRIARDLKKTSYTVNVMAGEKHLWRVVARDEFGARSESDWVFYVKKPNTPPKVKITSVKTNDRWIRVWWKASDPDGDSVKSELFLDGKSVEVLPGSPVKASYGEHRIDIIASDGEDETKVSTTVFLKEPSPPQKPTIKSSKRSLSGKYTLSWDAIDVDSSKLSFEIYLDGKKVSETRAKKLVLNLPPGRHKIRVVAVDDTGRRNSSEITVEIVKPVLKVNVPSVVWKRSVKVSWSFPVSATYSLYVDGRRVYQGQSNEVNLNLGYGKHHLKVVAEALGKKFEEEKIIDVIRPYDVLALSKGEGLFLIKVSERMRITDSMGGVFGKRIDYKGNTAVAVGESGEVYIVGTEDGYMVLLSILDENALDAAVGDGVIYVLTNEKVLKVNLDGSVIDERSILGGVSLSFDGNLYVGMDGKIIELDPNLTILRSWNTRGIVRKVLRDGNKLISVENWGVEIIGGSSLEFPDPRDVEKTKSGYVVADYALGVVFLDENLRTVGSVDVPEAVSIYASGDEVVAFGRGVYRIRNGGVVEKVGRGEMVFSTCKDFVATDEGLYLNEKKIFDGAVRRVRCSSGRAAFSSQGKLFIYDGKRIRETGISVSDFGIWKGEVYAVSDGKLLLIGRGSVSYVSKADAFGDGHYSRGREVYGLGGGNITARERVFDIAAYNNYVATLEKDEIEIFKDRTFVSKIPGHFQGIDVGNEEVFAYVSDKIYAFTIYGKEIWELPMGDSVRDIEYDGSYLKVSNGSNGLVIMNPEDGSIIYDEPVLICGGGK